MAGEYTVKLYEDKTLRGILHCRGGNLLGLLQDHGYLEHVPCGGKGICGACGVQIVKGAPLPGNSDRRFFTPEQIRAGMRLCCAVQVRNDMEVVLSDARDDPAVLLKTTVRNGGMGVTADDGYRQTGQEDRAAGAAEEVLRKRLPAAVLAVDLGTTTIAMELRGTADGSTLGRYAALNPQRKFGADVLSRIEAACSSRKTAGILQEQLRTVLQQGISYFEEVAPEWMGRDTPVFLAGNTTMEHLFMGHAVERLGKYPFTPVTLDWQETESAGHRVVLLPGFSAFVGADIAAGTAALGMLGRTEPPGGGSRECTGDALLIDLGTNAEMAYVHDGSMTVTATAAGPAFEGGITAGVFGADLISMTAKLLEQGVLDETGLLQGQAFERGAMMSDSSDGRYSGICVKNGDIRKLQLAKAAVAAGVEMLQVPENATVYLAGGFGYYLDPESACRVGLLPGIKKDRIHAVGNIVPTGIFSMACPYLADESYAAGVTERMRKTQIVNLAEVSGFNDVYLSHIHFPLQEKCGP